MPDETAGRQTGKRPLILIIPATSQGAPGPGPSNPLNRAVAEDFFKSFQICPGAGTNFDANEFFRSNLRGSSLIEVSRICPSVLKVLYKYFSVARPFCG